MSEKISPKLHESWLRVLADEFEQPYFTQIKATLLAEKEQGQLVYPPGSLIFNAFNQCPFEDVKVVILGQDPYHGAGQAHGLSFSVPNGVAAPRSLINIFKEIRQNFDLPDTTYMNPNLERWAQQGVFLLNAILTVRAATPESHKDIGWQHFTDAVIRRLSAERDNLIFLLWGNFAKKKATLIDAKKHHILTAGHPSPLSERYFFGCKHFATANKILTEQDKTPIEWVGN